MELESEWDFYIIFSLFKVAGICQGILGRVRDGTAASDFAIQMGKRAKMFADLGWEKAFSQPKSANILARLPICMAKSLAAVPSLTLPKIPWQMPATLKRENMM